ncbi:Hypothetical_protein [Hexamita inflata]|uniref:Hypothetical_protein n=1 Tax=Hexamita inflata TaxID=28002 RepID=A0AA86THE1_9EUKA|nr:Hypothetical protein HINF_LOCUS4906 [Hexamita inflata]
MLLVQHKFLLREPSFYRKNLEILILLVLTTKIAERAMKYRQRHTDSKKQISGTLLTDACFFNRKVVVDANGNKQNVIEFQYDDGTVEVKPINSGFVFLFIPLEEDWEPFLCFFQLHETGHASESDQPIAMDQMIKDLAKANFKVEITAWDGDSGYHAKNKLAFENIENKFFNRTVLDMYNLVGADQNLYACNDITHLLKRIHYRWAKMKIALEWKQNGNYFDLKELEEILQIDTSFDS